MMPWIAVFVGGGFGSLLRYLLAKHYNPVIDGYMTFPYGTFIANIASCFLLGVLMQKHMNGQLNISNQSFEYKNKIYKGTLTRISLENIVIEVQ